MTWQEITCAERDELMDALGGNYYSLPPELGIGALASGADEDGFTVTEIGYTATGEPLLKDEQWPRDPDRWPPGRSGCRHWRWVP